MSYWLKEREVAIEAFCPKCGFLNAYYHRYIYGANCTAAHCTRCHEGFAVVLNPVGCLGCQPEKQYVCFDLSRMVVADRIYIGTIHESNILYDL